MVEDRRERVSAVLGFEESAEALATYQTFGFLIDIVEIRPVVISGPTWAKPFDASAVTPAASGAKRGARGATARLAANSVHCAYSPHDLPGA